MKRWLTSLLFVLNLALIFAFSGPRLAADSSTGGLRNCCVEEACCISCCVLNVNCAGPADCENN